MDYEFNGISIQQEKAEVTENRLKAYADRITEKSKEETENAGK